MTTISNTFRTAEPGLTELLNQIHQGDVQLPDFQRGWVWSDEHIRSLIASISLSYPIGSVMLLEAGSDGARFKPRVVQGAPVIEGKKPALLILDGQQRMTSLYLALRSGLPVPTRSDAGKDIERIYYLDIARCLDPEADREEAVVSLSPDRMIKSDFNRSIDLDVSTDKKEFEAGMFPLNVLFDATRFSVWRRGYTRHFRHDDERLDAFDAFEAGVLQRFLQYRVPSIELTRETRKEAVCQVFEKVNTGGVALTVFELMTATFAADDFDLRKDWEGRRARLKVHQVLTSVEATDFLQAVTLLSSYQRHVGEGTGVSCKRKDILNLTLERYRRNADAIEGGFLAAARLLMREKVFNARNLPYRTQLVPLATTCALLGDRFEADLTRQKLARWYWCGVFGELYGGTTETRFGNDVVDLMAWFNDPEAPDPRTVRDSNLSPTRLLTLQTRNSAAYKGMMALLIQAGSHDFINGDPIEVTSFFDLAVEIHHIFPKAFCERHGHPRQRYDSVINKAPITARTNRIIGGNAPSKYLDSIEKNLDHDRLDAILCTHLIDPALLRADDFDAFIRARAHNLLDLVQGAIGKAVTGRDSEEVIRAFGGPLTTP